MSAVRHFALGFAIVLVSCGRETPPPETPASPPASPPSSVASSKPPPVIATGEPDAGAPSPSVEAKKRRALDLLQGKVPESELKVDSVGE